MNITQGAANRFSLLTQVGTVLRKFSNIDFFEALSSGQIESKKWLIENLEALGLPLGTVFVVGGWWGVLPAMMFESSLQIEKIRSFDLDPSCAPVADTMNRPYVINNWRFKASTADMLELDYRDCRYLTKRADGTEVETSDCPNTVINTSCEHIENFAAWWEKIPRGTLVVLQSNNLRSIPEHRNCVDSLEQFSESAPLTNLLASKELQLPEYKRFMLIGHK